MHTFVDVSPAEAAAHGLLAEYFAYRESTFPSASGYVTTFPDPERFTAPDGAFLGVELDGSMIGCGGIRRLDGCRFEVKHLWIRPGLQGQGLGRALLAELERRALHLGAHDLVLDTNASLAAAGGLYRSAGFREVEAYNDNPNATDWYAKTLDPGPRADSTR